MARKEPDTKYKATDIKRGVMFDTLVEQKCIALETPDSFGAFDGVDSDGVICSFSLVMVEHIHDDVRAAARAAYRLAATDTLLTAVATNDLVIANIYIRQLEGEREHRIIELGGTGVTLDDLEDMRVKK